MIYKANNKIKGCFLHKWKVDSDNGKTIYRKCLECGRAEIIQRDGGYQPIDHSYLQKKSPVETNFKTENLTEDQLMTLKLLVDVEIAKRGLNL